MHVCYDFKYAQVEKCMSTYRRVLEESMEKLKLKNNVCLQGLVQKPLSFLTFGDWFV